ncbi:MAG TPA: NAD(P)H-binding protein [Blastocatellia bacterium]|nr:NAD(P)H-binding protein [Blastocatellia bacterium]
MRDIFITGGTGYVGRRLIPELQRRGHAVRALVRAGSEHKLPAGYQAVVGDALECASFAAHVSPADTFIQLVGVPHPSPAKAEQFRSIDLRSIRASVEAAVAARVRHFIYVSVAQPAPVMKDYIEVRAEGERLIGESGLKATVLRPWYVLGPGHRWPHLLRPAYAVLERLPSTRDTARRLGLVTLRQMVAALADSVETVPDELRIIGVPEIRRY